MAHCENVRPAVSYQAAVLFESFCHQLRLLCECFILQTTFISQKEAQCHATSAFTTQSGLSSHMPLQDVTCQEEVNLGCLNCKLRVEQLITDFW